MLRHPATLRRRYRLIAHGEADIMDHQTTAAWVEAWGTWSATLHGAPGQPDLTLLVYPEAGDAREPWTWEVFEATRPSFRDPLFGGAPILEAAKACAEGRAAAYCVGGLACLERPADPARLPASQISA
jgi:hypothetical protein